MAVVCTVREKAGGRVLTERLWGGDRLSGPGYGKERGMK